MYKEGHFMGLSIALGSAFGVALITPFAIAFDMMAFIGLGPAIGVSIGVAVGASLEEKYKKEGKIIAQNPEVKERQRKSMKKFLFVGLGVFMVIIILVLMFVAFS